MLFLSFRYDICGKKEYKSFWFFFALVIFVLIAGLRFRIGADTTNYLERFYHEYPDITEFAVDDLILGRDPAFVLVNSFVKSLGGRFYVVQLIHALFINTMIFGYFKKHCPYIFTALFFYFIYLYLSFNMEIMRASTSIVICLYANDYVQEKKWIKGYFLYLVALTFHVQTLLLFILPLFFFLKFNKIGLCILLGAFLLGIFLQILLGDFMFLLEGNEDLQDKAISYVESEEFGEQNSTIAYIVLRVFVPLALALVSLLYLKSKGLNEAKKLEPFVMLGIMFMIMQLSFQVAYRFVDYYRIYFVILYATFFVESITNSIRLHKSVSFVRSMIIFSPLFFMIGLKYYGWAYRYNPYCSVIERKMDKNREIYFSTLSTTRKGSINEY